MYIDSSASLRMSLDVTYGISLIRGHLIHFRSYSCHHPFRGRGSLPPNDQPRTLGLGELLPSPGIAESLLPRASSPLVVIPSFYSPRRLYPARLVYPARALVIYQGFSLVPPVAAPSPGPLHIHVHPPPLRGPYLSRDAYSQAILDRAEAHLCLSNWLMRQRHGDSLDSLNRGLIMRDEMLVDDDGIQYADMTSSSSSEDSLAGLAHLSHSDDASTLSDLSTSSLSPLSPRDIEVYQRDLNLYQDEPSICSYIGESSEGQSTYEIGSSSSRLHADPLTTISYPSGLIPSSSSRSSSSTSYLRPVDEEGPIMRRPIPLSQVMAPVIAFFSGYIFAYSLPLLNLILSKMGCHPTWISEMLASLSLGDNVDSIGRELAAIADSCSSLSSEIGEIKDDFSSFSNEIAELDVNAIEAFNEALDASNEARENWKLLGLVAAGAVIAGGIILLWYKYK